MKAYKDMNKASLLALVAFTWLSSSVSAQIASL